jgi:hypothetical protein
MTAAKLPKEQFPFGACPFMSEVYVQPTSKLTMPAGSGPIPLGGAYGPAIQMIPIPCLGPDCQLWHKVEMECDLGRSREVWTHEQNLPAGALTGKSGADGSGEIVKALRSLQLVLESLHKKLK